MLTGILPGLVDDREPLAPPLVEALDHALGGVGVDHAVDRLQIARDLLAVAPGDVPEAVADEVHDARLHPSAGPYLAAVIALPEVKAQIRNMQVDGNCDGLNVEQIGNLEVPVPTMAEALSALGHELNRVRRAHARILTRVMHNLALLAERRQALSKATAAPRR
jgi:hypothetical protein